MPSELAYKIADDIVSALFANGAKQKACRLVLELENGRNGGGWSYRPARDHIADVVEKHITSIESAQQSMPPTLLTGCASEVDCPNCGYIVDVPLAKTQSG